MLTIDDINTILEKYGNTGFWYKIDFSKINHAESSGTWTQDFVTITAQYYSGSHRYIHTLTVANNLSQGILYVTESNGDLYQTNYSYSSSDNEYIIDYIPYDGIVWLYLSQGDVTLPEEEDSLNNYMFIPLSPLSIPVVNGEYPTTFYVKLLTNYSGDFTVNGTVVSKTSKGNNVYAIELTNPVTSVIGFKQTTSGKTFEAYTVRFNEMQPIPNLTVSTLYKGASQKITILNADNDAEISDFQAYYQGRKLKDNIIDLPYDVDDVIDITVDLRDNNYVNSTVKLKANTELKYCKTETQIKNAINNGIKTVQAYPTGSGAISVTDVEWEGVTFIDSHIRFLRCKLDNITFIGTENKNNERIRIQTKTVANNCIFDNIPKFDASRDARLNNCALKSTDVKGYSLSDNGAIPIVFTGTIENCTISECIILSDGDITITDCTFTGTSDKDYFPNFLYLTGNYTVKNNSFTLEDEWTAPAFNMCIIKTNPDFNPADFIANNTFDLNITYGDEPTDTFYYCFVDDDRIKARRLS
jgi:hypothetical protein